MQIELYDGEIEIIRQYQKHLWNVGKVSKTQRETLTRIIVECGVELDIIERELNFEKNKPKK